MPRRHKPTAHTPFLPQNGATVCRAKQKFPSDIAARRAAELKNLENSALTLSTYRCDYCQKWHLTRNQMQ